MIKNLYNFPILQTINKTTMIIELKDNQHFSLDKTINGS